MPKSDKPRKSLYRTNVLETMALEVDEIKRRRRREGKALRLRPRNADTPQGDS